jgi:dihydropteroate synthase
MQNKYMSAFSQSMRHFLRVNGNLLDLSRPNVMGILNITPDSFFAGSRVNDLADVISRATEMLSEGADMLDIGGYSTRPGAIEVSE